LFQSFGCRCRPHHQHLTVLGVITTFAASPSYSRKNMR
jgi:hypothetical protein